MRGCPPTAARSISDDPSAIGTYAAAGAAFGPPMLWTAPVTLPMMVAVVYRNRGGLIASRLL